MNMQISDLRHRLHLCSQKDVVTEGGDWRLARQNVKRMWAKIEAKAASTFSPQGATMGESKDKRSHQIVTRYHRELNITTMAWLYEERRKSSPRWFKILKAKQTEHAGNEYFVFDCRLVEQHDETVRPTVAEECAATPLPNGVSM